MRELRCAGPTRFRDRNDHIDLVRRHGRDDALGQRFAQIQTRLINRNTVQHRIRPRQIHKLENARVELGVDRALLGMHHTFHVDKHRFAGRDVALELMRGAFQCHRFTGHHHRGAVFIAAMPNAQRPDAERVTKRQQAVAGNQRHHRVRALDAFVYATHRRKHIGRTQRQAARGFFQLVRQHIEQHFGVAVGVDVAVIGMKQLGLQLGRIRQVAVVRQHQAERRVDIKRLRLVFAEGIACRRVAHLTQTHIARQRPHVASTKHVAHHALGLVHEKLAPLLRDDARRILAAMLQQQQAVIDQLIDRGFADNADYSAHGV